MQLQSLCGMAIQLLAACASKQDGMPDSYKQFELGSCHNAHRARRSPVIVDNTEDLVCYCIYHQHVEECCGSKGLACKTTLLRHPLLVFVGEGCGFVGMACPCQRLVCSRLYTDQVSAISEAHNYYALENQSVCPLQRGCQRVCSDGIFNNSNCVAPQLK